MINSLIERWKSNPIKQHLEPESRRKIEAQAVRIALEQANIQRSLVFADLPLFRERGTFPKRFALANDESLTLDDFVSKNDDELRKKIDLVRVSDRAKVDQYIDTFAAKHPEVLKSLGINALTDLDPAIATTLALEITASCLSYAYPIAGYYKSLSPEWKGKIDQMRLNGTYGDWLVGENDRLDNMAVDQLLEEGQGVCRHFVVAAMGIYENLKMRDQTGKLKNTALVYATSDTADFHDVDNHAYCILLAYREGYGTMISVTDPTFYLTRHFPLEKELCFTSERFTTAINLILGERFLEKTGVLPREIAAAIEHEITRRKTGRPFFLNEKINEIFALYLVEGRIPGTTFPIAASIAKTTRELTQIGQKSGNPLPVIYNTVLRCPLVKLSSVFFPTVAEITGKLAHLKPKERKPKVLRSIADRLIELDEFFSAHQSEFSSTQWKKFKFNLGKFRQMTS